MRKQPPDWYGLLQAAQRLGVPPWELDGQSPALWTARALQALEGEGLANKYFAEKAKAEARR